MPKNIVIFSDGTGQAGGLKPDQNLSNIYKLYRAARPGPESPINPADQVAVYDAGLGTESDEGKIPFRPIQKFRKLWSGATGTGISRNIADCYEAILKHYEPGDRVFVFGFSRGAYTARCVGGVMSLCGVPTQAANGGPLPRYGKALRKIADEAVSQVYEHGSGSDKPQRKAERQEIARRFREKYGSANSEGLANEVPYFVGVFDTVASLGAPFFRRLLMLLGLSLFVAVMTALAAGVASFLIPWFTFATTYTTLAVLIVIAMAGGYLKAHLKTIRDFPSKGDFAWHIAAWRFRFYDNSLNPRVQYARHALAIDETRKDFARVPWASPKDWPARHGPEWLRQVWFAGNHSDIGGGYPEDESRLSDIALKWMLEQATELPAPLKVDLSRLNLFPDPAGMQHDEIESLRDSYPGWWPEKLRFVWARQVREMRVDAPLHPTVLERLKIAGGAGHYGLRANYRPENLSNHLDARKCVEQAQSDQPSTMHSSLA